MYVINRVSLTSQRALLHRNNFAVAHFMQAFQWNSFAPAMLVDTNDFCHAVPQGCTSFAFQQNSPSPPFFFFFNRSAFFSFFFFNNFFKCWGGKITGLWWHCLCLHFDWWFCLYTLSHYSIEIWSQVLTSSAYIRASDCFQISWAQWPMAMQNDGSVFKRMGQWQFKVYSSAILNNS